MITLSGILRQSGEVKIKEQPRLKLVVEHETARDNGMPDLHLETFIMPPGEATKLPRTGEEVHVEVRPYVAQNGRSVSFAAVGLLAVAEIGDSSVTEANA